MSDDFAYDIGAARWDRERKELESALVTERAARSAAESRADALARELEAERLRGKVRDNGIFACKAVKPRKDGPQEWQPRLCSDDPDDDLANAWDDEAWELTHYPTPNAALDAAAAALRAAGLMPQEVE